MSLRCFLAVTPDPQTALAIEAWRQRCWSSLQRATPAQNYHLTLAFLGKPDARQRETVEMELANLRCHACSIELDEAGYWPGNGIVWLGSRQPNDALDALAGQCRRLANRAGIGVDKRPFTAHLTLARGQREPPPAPLLPPDFSIGATSIDLYESILDRQGARYRLIGSVALMEA